MRPMIEPSAGRLFDIYYRHVRNSTLEDLQSLTEEAYKLHERLRKLNKNNDGLLDLDEFLLLKALRNYSVHQGEFIGEAFSIKEDFAQQLGMELGKVCLIDKAVVTQAINFEPPLENGEGNKVARIKTQLVDFGDYYNIEPVIFNFMVKVYEKLVALQLSIPGKGFTELEHTYKKEIYHNYPHYIKLQPSNVDAHIITQNLIPLSEVNFEEMTGLVDEKDDPFNFNELALDCSDLEVVSYTSTDEYEALRHALIKKIMAHPEILTLVS
ncbi:MAG: hypothetical protein HRU38_18695, partial [Saccharospirillaceae bacterium]|nr:hypothetical protein [Saccharospirillaceae bacterium]